MPGAIPPSGTTPPMESFCIQVPMSSEWLGLVTGALLKLTYGYYWDKSIEGWEDAQATGKAILNSWLEHNPCVAELAGDADCTDFPLSSGFVNYYPLSPYLSAGQTPEGWTNPPFGFANGADLLLGYQEGDILVTGFPEPDSGDLTLPSITFHLTGDGEIELHMLLVPNGGMAVVTVDGDLLNLDTFDLNADLVSLPAETTALELVYEKKFETTGDHTVEVRFAPVLDDTFIPIRYGGGIRAVVLCGFNEMSLDIRTDPENDCLVQKTYDGTTWSDVIDVANCANIEVARTATNTAGKAWRISGGVTQYSTDNVTWNNYTDAQAVDFGLPSPEQIGDPVGVDKPCLRAKNNVAFMLQNFADLQAQLRVGASVAYLISAVMSALVAVLSLGSGIGISAAILGFTGAITNAGTNFFSSLFTPDVIDQLTCDLNDAFESDGSMTSAGFASLIALFNSRGTAVWYIIAYWFQCLGPIGMVLAGSPAKSGITSCDDDPCDRDWYTEFNFLTSPSPMHAASTYGGASALPIPPYTKFSGDTFKWVYGKGLKSVLTDRRNSGGERGYQTGMCGYMTLPAGLSIHHFEVDSYTEPYLNGGSGSPYFVGIYHANTENLAGPSIINTYNPAVNVGQKTITSSIFSTPYVTVAGDELLFQVFVQPNSGSIQPEYGLAYIQKLRLYPS